MKKKGTAVTLTTGILCAYFLYLAAQLLIAAIAVRIPVSEKSLTAVQSFSALCAVFCGSLITIRRGTSLKKAGASLAVAGAFLLLVLLSGFLLYNRIDPAGEKGIWRILAAAFGGILPCFFGSGKRKKTKRKKRK